MSYDKREKSRRKRKNVRIIIISFVVLYLLFRSVPSLLANGAKTILPEIGDLTTKFSAEGFLIKHETVIKSEVKGQLEMLAAEGTRLAAGSEVVSVNSLKDTSSLKEELEQVEESISALEKSEAETKLIINEKEKVENLKESLVDELQSSIIAGNFDEIYLLKDQLALYDEKIKDVSFSNTLAGQSLGNLKSKREVINEEIKSNHAKYYSAHGGIVSYIIDGYEETYLPKELENYTYDKLNSIKSKKNEVKTEVDVGQPIYKIIDNFEWYIAMKIEDLKEIKGFEVGDSVQIQMNENNYDLKGRIVSINESGKKGVMIVRFTTKLHDYYDIRFTSVDVIQSRKEGYRIPTKAIIDKDNLSGVYIKDKSGIVKFRPVKIIGQDNDYTYVDMGDNGNILLEGEEKPTKTITLFDEIFINTTSIKEGQILN
ncbi:HlyD family efflux transporter periplasmic adaptor subunit [Tissierella sp. MB52-C2]|uniref:HlyD family efflux transporter periplasmic adaptor subunit n=1 Tax=Tissierella sp. MB52-C2 TaxID=3070999 RepID=UPI00280AE992|nr:HlyD family efflux transporter periplasmic adaptor subunit [Tissierella sp. MB52-C2]WMM26774.1 HlyD family efflux transporter periplasmic adaptor subunit [Tissierella sp. MB52-C2]